MSFNYEVAQICNEIIFEAGSSVKKTGAGPPPLFWLLTPMSLYPQTLTSIISVSCFWTRRYRDDTPNSVVDSHSFLGVHSQFIIVNGIALIPSVNLHEYFNVCVANPPTMHSAVPMSQHFQPILPKY